MKNNTATTEQTKLDWRESLPVGDRVINIRDEQLSYYAALPVGMTEEEAITDFVSTYDYNHAEDEQWDDAEAQQEADEARLRNVIRVDMVEWTLSAPAKGGYAATFSDLCALRTQAATILDCQVADIVTGESEDGEVTFLYASEADEQADEDGAYAVKYYVAQRGA